MRRLMSVLVAAGALAVVLRSAGNESAYAGKEWAAPGGDWASTRYSTLAQIDAANVKHASAAPGRWTCPIDRRPRRRCSSRTAGCS